MAAKPSHPAGMAGTRPTGRPRKIRSRPTSGVGGRPFTESESQTLVKIGVRYADDAFDRDKLLDSLWMAHGSYEADDAASREQVGIAEELRDIEAIQADAARVRVLLATQADAQDPASCIGPAAALSLRMANFPNMVAAATTAMPEGIDFMHAQLRLAKWLVRVRHWPQHRARLLADIDLVLSVCDRVPIPAGGTKRFKGARKRFERDVAAIYRAQLHPARVALWRESRDGRNDPPPPDSGRAFARAVMEALGVPFEVKRGKG